MAPGEVGFYGKLPSHGDFLRRRVADAFVARWDAWLQESIAASRTSLGNRWLDVYLTSPAWRFVCAGGVFGIEPVVGLTVPSVDRVGRYFHLTLVAMLPEEVNVVAAATRLTKFFESADQVVIDTLAAETIDFEHFDSCVAQLRGELDASSLTAKVEFESGAGGALLGNGPARWQLPIASASELVPILVDLASDRIKELYDPVVMLWTDGSAIVEPTCLVSQGLPPPDSFGALLDGSWAPHHWQSLPVRAAAREATVEAPVVDVAASRFRSAGATDVGCVRTVNQDSRLERTEAGLWAVADGMGGHSEGEVASRMVCDALADFTLGASFNQMIEAASARLHDVNEYLVRRATGTSNGAVSGSTVVVLLARDTQCAVLWAGDSRVYRMRDGLLEQLTHDHSLSEVDGLTSASNVVTRAIGGEASLALDVFRDRVQTGDRFLLCSDGLTRFVPEPQIRQWMQHAEIQAAVEGLIDTTLVAGAPDNVTAIIVEAY